MDNNILCQKEEQVAVTAFFEEVSKILKECDECEEKEKIKEILHSMNDTVLYLFLGEEAVGKTTLIKALFQNILEIREDMNADICEYRYGEQELTTQSVNGFQKRFVTSENLKGLSIVDTKGLNHLNKGSLKQINDFTRKCEVLFVVLDVGHINSPTLWDVIEDIPDKNMVFFLTKCDLLSKEEIAANIAKTKRYMKEANISAPVFPVSLIGDEEKEGVTPLNEVCSYIGNQVIGTHPILTRQRKHIEEARILLGQMRESFRLRQRQYHSDVEILQKINRGLDAYIMNQEKVIDDLVSKVVEEIHKDIDAYQNEIISKMDPYKIKERFRNQQDFTDYLNMVNENYKNIMNDSVNRKTINAIKNCLHELEIVYDDAVGYFNERECILALNDKFYGSLSTGRKQMIAETRENALAVSRLYKTLTDSSETLFLQIWKERNKYDTKIAIERTLTSVSGGSVGAVGGVAAAKGLIAMVPAVAAEKCAEGVAALAVLSNIALIPIGVILGAATIYSITKVIYEPMAGKRMEEVTRNCIAQFKEEVSKTRTVMIEQISSQIREIFKKELSAVDGLFAEFRMSVNIDERKLPILEANLEKTEKMLAVIDNL